MRTFCQRIAAPQSQEKEKEEKLLVPVAEEASDISTKTVQTKSSQGTILSTPKKTADNSEIGPSKSETKKKSKAEQIAERHPKRSKRTNGPPGNPPGTKEAKIAARMSSQMSWETSKMGSSNGKIVLFVSCGRRTRCLIYG
jgi:hypothetical protein